MITITTVHVAMITLATIITMVTPITMIIMIKTYTCNNDSMAIRIISGYNIYSDYVVYNDTCSNNWQQ